MKKFRFLAWAGAIFNFLVCYNAAQALVKGSWFPDIVTLALCGAGMVLCIALIQKKAWALPKARLQLLIYPAWAVLGNVAAYAMNPQPSNPVLIVVFMSIPIALYLIVWKIWSSENAEKYADVQAS